MQDPVAKRRDARAAGLAAESQVAAVLEAEGWTICARNWLGGGGELDLVAERSGQIRFVEVKARAVNAPVGLEAVGLDKQRRLSRAARAWLSRWDGPFDEASFTVVLVEGETLTWVHDAFDAVL